jgi:3-hydroxyacyl-CoA dehydrogenase
MIPAGGSVSATEALKIGLVDRVAEGDAREAGLAYARELLEERRAGARRGRPAPTRL